LWLFWPLPPYCGLIHVPGCLSQPPGSGGERSMRTLRALVPQAMWFTAVPLLLMSGCVYAYDPPYGSYGTYRADPGNCGTPAEPRACSEYDAPPTGYGYSDQAPQYPTTQYAPPQYPPQQYGPPQNPSQQYGSPTPLSPSDPYGRGNYPAPPTSGPGYGPSYPPPGSNDRDDDGPYSGR
jgi:hypothetical protein